MDIFAKFWNQNRLEALSLRHSLNKIKEEQLQGCSEEGLSFAMELIIQSNPGEFWVLASCFLERYAQQEKDIRNFDHIWKGFELLAHWLFICEEKIAKLALDKMSDILKKDEWFQRLLQRIIYEADTSKNRERFWLIWNGMFEVVERMVKSEEKHQKEDSDFSWKGEHEVNYILLEYLLAGHSTWKSNTTQWELVTSENIDFWERCCKAFAFHKATLLGIGYFANHIGFEVAREKVIIWIYEIVNSQDHLWKVELLTNTMYYLENYMKIYCDYHIKEIKTNFNIKKKVLRVLDFMVEKESTIGFILRDEL